MGFLKDLWLFQTVVYLLKNFCNITYSLIFGSTICFLRYFSSPYFSIILLYKVQKEKYCCFKIHFSYSKNSNYISYLILLHKMNVYYLVKPSWAIDAHETGRTRSVCNNLKLVRYDRIVLGNWNFVFEKLSQINIIL